MRTRVIALKIKKESKESLFGGRFLNVSVQEERRGEEHKGIRRQRKTGEKEGRAGERRRKT